MSSENANKLFWLSYADAVKSKVGVDLGNNGIFFLATEAQKGPVGGDDVPDEYTNQGLYDIANNLLATDSLFYDPSSLHSYTEALATYLAYVDTGATPDSALDSAILAAIKDCDAANNNLNTQRDAAFARFTKEKGMGLIPNGDFYDYVQAGKASTYTTALDEVDNSSQTLDALQKKGAGPMASTVIKDRALLNKGKNEDKDYPGYNMHGAMGNIKSPAELVRDLKNGAKPTAPDFSRIPAYSAPQYKQFIQEAMRKSQRDELPSGGSIDIKIDTEKTTSDYHLGQVNWGAGGDVSYGGWFTFGASASHSQSKETLDTHDESSNVKVTVVYDQIRKIAITPGKWNVDVSKYKLVKSAPHDVASFAKVTQLVVASYIGYVIEVGSKTADSLDKKLKESTTASAGIRVFGIPIGLSGSGGSSSEDVTHDASWDYGSKKLTVKPSSDTGFATVIGVVGEKIKMAGSS